jgi:hypothetical protein
MAETTTTGTIIDHLTADHEQIKGLFSDVMFVRPENRADVFCQLVTSWSSTKSPKRSWCSPR